MRHNLPHLRQKLIGVLLHFLTSPQFRLYFLQHLHIINQLNYMLILLHQFSCYRLMHPYSRIKDLLE